MAVGIYGTKKLADVDFNDVDILYAYSPTRESVTDNQLRPLFANISNSDFTKMFGADGAYKLKLPASIFNKLGFYVVLIKPKTFETNIIDCSFVVTETNEDIQISRKGIVIPKLQFQGTGSLIGYQVEYFDDNGVKIKNFHKIITGSDPVSPAQNTSQSVQGSTTSYTLNDNGASLFLTLTPDEVSLISNLAKADLGKAGQKILISNTFFDPIMMEVEMVDQTIKTLSYGIFGNSTRDMETGLFSIFDENNNLYKQYNLLTRKKIFSNGNIDYKEQRTSINYNQSFNDLSQQ
jgi:hypothetical protein